MGICQVHNGAQFYGRHFAALSCGGGIHRKVSAGASSQSDACTFPDDVRRDLCEEVYEGAGQAGVYQSVYCEEERD